MAGPVSRADERDHRIPTTLDTKRLVERFLSQVRLQHSEMFHRLPAPHTWQPGSVAPLPRVCFPGPGATVGRSIPLIRSGTALDMVALHLFHPRHVETDLRPRGQGTTSRDRNSNANNGQNVAGPTREPLAQADEPSATRRARVRRAIRLMAGFVSM
jgi:hypothetical protein